MKISVCMATYNGEKYIAKQLESILSQLSAGDEVIVSDDNSTDNTIDIIKSIDDSRIKLFVNQKEKGYTRNFENALEKATGDIIFLSDQDDVWVKTKVKTMLTYLIDYDFVVSDNIIVDENLRPLHQSHFEIYKTQKGFVKNLILPRYVGACMAFKKEVLKKSLPFPSNARLCAHDYWIGLIAELYFKTYKLNEPMILYRRHGSNASTGGKKSKNSLSHKFKVRIYTILNLFTRMLR